MTVVSARTNPPPTYPEPGRDTPLDAVLGRHRAGILRMTDRPCSMGEIAARLHYLPGTITYHCDLLVRANLAERIRHGRHSLLIRTELGTRLVAVLDEPRAASA